MSLGVLFRDQRVVSIVLLLSRRVFPCLLRGGAPDESTSCGRKPQKQQGWESGPSAWPTQVPTAKGKVTGVSETSWWQVRDSLTRVSRQTVSLVDGLRSSYTALSVDLKPCVGFGCVEAGRDFSCVRFSYVLTSSCT